GPEAAATMMLGFPGNTTRSCSWIASERTCGRSVNGVQCGVGSSQLVVFQMPPLLAPTYITLGLLGSGAATSMRPAKGPPPLPDVGPMGVQLVLLSVMLGSVRPSKHSSTGRNTWLLRRGGVALRRVQPTNRDNDRSQEVNNMVVLQGMGEGEGIKTK